MSPICCFGYVQGRSLAQSVLKLEKADYSCSEDFVIHMWKYKTCCFPSDYRGETRSYLKRHLHLP